MDLVFATGNAGKLREAAEILGPGYRVLSPADVGLPGFDVEETGSTFRENSLLKAQALWQSCGLPCFADDSGLEVDALGGAPGIYSARYASDHNFASNIDRLLSELAAAFQGGNASDPVRGSAAHPSQPGGWAPPSNVAEGGTPLGGTLPPERIPPHVLVMTATPIPRTLAMTVYGDLDVSVIDELPPGRKPVKTALISDSKKASVYNFMRKQIALGRQVFVVYPLIFESEKIDLNNLELGYEEILKRFPESEYKVAIVHGQQTTEVKNFNMDAFVSGRANILVSTTVIEVGVDVPNASVMVIESAQRFGLSQLHQLRGRVGRGADESYCILVHDFKTGKEARERLELMCRTNDGFEIAEEDMKMRGPGDLEGTAQSGLPVTLNIASIARDGILLGEARAYANRVLEADPALEDPRNALLARELRKSKYDIKDYSKIS